jgi:hypothetical protein
MGRNIGQYFILEFSQILEMNENRVNLFCRETTINCFCYRKIQNYIESG